MKIANLSVVVSIVFALSACSKGPSESDAKNIINQRISDCKSISLESFKKTNGVPQGENGYLVYVDYSLKAKGFTKIKKAVDEAVARIAEIDNQLEKLKPDSDTDLAEQNAVEQQIQKLLEQNYQFGMDHIKSYTESDSYNLKNEQLKEQKRIEIKGQIALLHEEGQIRHAKFKPVQDLMSKLRDERGDVASGLSTALENERSTECKDGGANYNFYRGNDFGAGTGVNSIEIMSAIENYTKDVTKDFSGTIHMIKTDNGWMEAAN